MTLPWPYHRSDGMTLMISIVGLCFHYSVHGWNVCTRITETAVSFISLDRPSRKRTRLLCSCISPRLGSTYQVKIAKFVNTKYTKYRDLFIFGLLLVCSIFFLLSFPARRFQLNVDCKRLHHTDLGATSIPSHPKQTRCGSCWVAECSAVAVVGTQLPPKTAF